MSKLVKTRISGEKTEIIYELEVQINEEILLKLSDMGTLRWQKFSRFDKLLNPPFQIQAPNKGFVVTGRMGERVLFCLFTGKERAYHRELEFRLHNVA